MTSIDAEEDETCTEYDGDSGVLTDRASTLHMFGLLHTC